MESKCWPHMQELGITLCIVVRVSSASLNSVLKESASLAEIASFFLEEPRQYM